MNAVFYLYLPDSISMHLAQPLNVIQIVSTVFIICRKFLRREYYLGQHVLNIQIELKRGHILAKIGIILVMTPQGTF